MSKQVTLRQRVYAFYEKHENKGKKFTINHFMDEGCKKSTLYDIIDRCERGLSVFTQSGRGRKAKIFNKKSVCKLKRLTNNKCGLSQRKLAKIFNCSQAHVSMTLKHQTDINCFKRTIIPRRTGRQIEEARPKCRYLYIHYGNLDWVIDDESYFTVTHSRINGNRFYYTDDKKNAPASVKYAPKSKFEEKVLVWMAISEKGFSEPFIVESGLAINQEVYREDCLRSRLVPFLKKYHSDGNYIFWPDLATSHYANSVIQFMEGQNIKFVEKVNNPANVPECRPIEDFWSQLKGKVY